MLLPISGRAFFTWNAFHHYDVNDKNFRKNIYTWLLLKYSLLKYSIDCQRHDQKGGIGLAHLEKFFLEILCDTKLLNYEKASSPWACFSARSALCQQPVHCLLCTCPGCKVVSNRLPLRRSAAHWSLPRPIPGSSAANSSLLRQTIPSQTQNRQTARVGTRRRHVPRGTRRLTAPRCPSGSQVDHFLFLPLRHYNRKLIIMSQYQFIREKYMEIF